MKLLSALILVLVMVNAHSHEIKGKNHKAWVLTNVYWNSAGGQVCEFKQVHGNHYRRIVRQRGYGCPSYSTDPYKEK